MLINHSTKKTITNGRTWSTNPFVIDLSRESNEVNHVNADRNMYAGFVKAQLSASRRTHFVNYKHAIIGGIGVNEINRRAHRINSRRRL